MEIGLVANGGCLYCLLTVFYVYNATIYFVKPEHLHYVSLWCH